jgi:hypothetical protein
MHFIKYIQTQLEDKGFKGYTLKEVINKIKKLRQKFKQEKNKTKCSGSGAGKKWKFFDDIDTFLTKKHNVTPPVLVDTMNDMTQSEEEKDFKRSIGTVLKLASIEM